MPPSLFTVKEARPDGEGLALVLGDKAGLWAEIRRRLENELGELTDEWKYYGPKAGWVLKTLLKKRNLFFLTPDRGILRISFVFGDKAVAAVQAGGFPDSLVRKLVEAKKYAEGRGLRLEVRTPAEAEAVVRLAKIKAAGY